MRDPCNERISSNICLLNRFLKICLLVICVLIGIFCSTTNWNLTDFSFPLNYTNNTYTLFQSIVSGSLSRNVDNFSIAVLSYHAVTRTLVKSPRNIRENCSLQFDCLVYYDASKSFPYGAMANFSALIAYGPGHRRIIPLYKENGFNMSARPREQYWVSVMQESAVNRGNGEHVRGIANLFNWTTSAGRGLTFQLDYFLIERLKKHNSISQVEADVKEKLAKKDKLVCWAMSNCAVTFTNRVKLASDLVRNLPEKLHHFGKGSRCLSGVKDNITFHGALSQPIESEIEKCWFYLSFENSNCTDYITEKFSNALRSYAIPIVNGWKESYDKRLPGSYIHAKDFPSGKELSRYIENLRKNFTAYFQFHKWRQFYYVGNDREDRRRLNCEVCRRLKKEKDSGYKKDYIIDNLVNVYSNMQTCIKR